MKPLDPIKQEALLRAVFTIAGRSGLAGINIAGISKEAQVGIGSLYTYFKSKDDIIQAAYASARHTSTKKMYDHFDIDIPIRDSLKRIYINALNYRLKHYDETVFMDQYIQSDYVQLNFAKQVKEFEEENKPLYNLLKRGQDDGSIMEADRFILISFFNSAVRSASNAMLQKLIPVKKQVVEHYFEMVWKGMSK